MSSTQAAQSTPKLKNPPAIEVLCEIRVEPTQPFSIIPGALYERIKERYKNLEALPISELPPDVIPPFNVSHRYKQPSSPYLVQVGKKVCSVNSIKPYRGFEEFKEEIAWAFKHYKEVSNYKRITRIALRYINRLPVLPGLKADKIINFKFELANKEIVPKEAILRSVIDAGESGTLNMVVSTGRQHPKEAIPSILLDLDLYSTAEAAITENYMGWLDVAHQFQYSTFRRMVNSGYLELLDKEKDNA